MKLVCIGHERCGEDTGCYTVLWAPDEITEEQFSKDAELAQERYLKTLQEHDKAPAKSMYSLASPPSIGFFRVCAAEGLSILQALEKWESLKQLEQERLAAYRRASKSFADYMEELGYRKFYAHEIEMQDSLYWGHHHSLPIEYSETEVKEWPSFER